MNKNKPKSNLKTLRGLFYESTWDGKHGIFLGIGFKSHERLKESYLHVRKPPKGNDYET